MRTPVLKAQAILPLLLLAGGCDDEFLSACYSCLETDPALMVPAEQTAKIRLLPEGNPLPASASHIFYDETCGIDCQQLVRFDLPSDTALEQVAEASGKGPARFEPADLTTQTVTASWVQQDWFVLPKEGRALAFTSNMEQDGPWPTSIILVEGEIEEGMTRVYWYAGTM